jgi:hypothetical protein
MWDIMRGDPHELLLRYVVGPIKPVEPSVQTLAGQWTQLANFHQETAQMIHGHFTDLLQGGGPITYSSPAAQTLWNTHQTYQQYFTTLVDHAQTQQGRYAALGGHYSNFLSQAPGKVYSLSTPMAALGVLTYETVAAPPPPVLEDPLVTGVEGVIEGVAIADLAGEPEDLPLLPIVLVIIAVLVVILVIVIIYVAIRDATQDHQQKQKQTTVPKPPHGPVNSLTPDQESLAQRLYKDYQGTGLSLDDIRKIIEENPNLTEAQLRELLDQYARVIAMNPNLVKTYGALAVFEKFIELAAYDPAHGGDYPSRRPVQNMPDLQPGIDDAMAELGAMEEGKVPWPLTQSTDPAYEATDPAGQKWDVKKYPHVDTNGKVYDPVNTVDKLQKDFGKGEKVIFDDSGLSQTEIDETYRELKRRGQDGDVVWWPTEPNP